MRVLIYGFGPYKQFKTNITQQILRKLSSSRNLKKIVFPVRFDKKQFANAVKRYRPDFVLGLGQCSTGRLLRIEQRAANRRRNDRKEKARPIVRGQLQRLATTLRLNELGLKQTKISVDAGDYVCNFSMYVILNYLRRHRPDARFGLVHVPHDYDSKKAVKFVRKVLRALKNAVRHEKLTPST
jgi:pyrrolidone-carboxylate peptidase